VAMIDIIFQVLALVVLGCLALLTSIVTILVVGKLVKDLVKKFEEKK
jgi:hypothetical protein